MAKLHLIDGEPENAHLHAVFFHGVGGSSVGTWQARGRPKGETWLSWLIEDVPNIAIWTVEYDASPSEWTGDAMPLADRGDNIWSLVRTEHRLARGDIAFVGHSMGGLVAGQVVRCMDRDRAQPKADDFLSRVRRIAFLGTPHRGSRVALILSLTRLFRPTVAVKDLRAGALPLREFNSWFRKYVVREEVAVLALAESKRLKFLWLLRAPVIVSSYEADAGLVATPTFVDEDHLSISKPDGRDNECYKAVVDFMKTPLKGQGSTTRLLEEVWSVGDQVKASRAESAVAHDKMASLLEVVGSKLDPPTLTDKFVPPGQRSRHDHALITNGHVTGRKANSGQLWTVLPETFQRRFGAWIRQVRTTAGLTEMDVARLVYKDETKSGQVSNVERGRDALSTDTISLFCAGLQIDQNEVERLRKGSRQNWPAIFCPNIRIDRKVVGRDNDLTKLHDLLIRTQTVDLLPGAVVRATGGMGKSMLARHYSARYGHLYRGVWWINAADRETAIAGLCELADALSLNEPSGRSDEALAKKAILALQAETDPWLIVYDNAIRHRDLNGLVPVRGSAHLLYTSREGGWPNLQEMPCDPLPTGPGANLLEQESGRKEDRLGAERLAVALDGLPLALVCAGAWLRDVPSVSFDGYLERIEDLLDDLPETLADYNVSVYAAVSLSIDRLSEDARMLLKAFAFLASEGLDPDLVTVLDGQEKQSDPDEAKKFEPVPQPLLRLARDRQAIDRAFADLERRSLMEPGANGKRLHRLVQATQRIQLRNETDAWAATAAAMVAAGYPDGAEPAYARNFSDCTRLAPHVAALHAGRGGGPSTRAMDYLYNQASVYAWAMRQDQLALRYSIANLRAKQRRGVPSTHILMIMGWSNLAKDLGNRSRVVWAERASAHAVSLAEANPSITKSHYAISLSNHGEHLRALAQHCGGATGVALFDRSRVRFHQALRLDRIVHGQRSREVAIRLNNLASLYDFRGRRGAARNIYRAALSIRRKVLPPEDAHLGEACHNLGALLLEEGELAEAQALLEQALAIREAAFSANPNHPLTRDTARRLVSLFLLNSDLGAAKVVATRYGLEMTEFSPTF